MKTLTERILSRWTGTGVMVRVLQDGKLRTDRVLDGGLMDAIVWNIEKQRFPELTHKLLLRPNSDLTKKIMHNGEAFVPIVRLWELYCERKGFCVYNGETTISVTATKVLLHDTNSNVLIEIDTSDFDGYSYRTISKLHEWHFACGLDESLWIDLNVVEGI